MKPGTKVKTESHGTGIILHQEFVSKRYCVKLDNCPGRFKDMHMRQGGLYYWGCELLTL